MSDELRKADELEAQLLQRLAEIREFKRLTEERNKLAAKLNIVVGPIDVVDGGGSDLSVADITDMYRTDRRSPYQEIRYASRHNYDHLIRRLLEECGDKKIASLRTGEIEQLYANWKQRGIATANGIVTMFRQVANFGATVLKDEKCLLLQVILHNLKLDAVEKSNTEQLSREQAQAIIETAHKIGPEMAPIALAQAFQIDCDLGQKDVIGEWVPASENEPGVSHVIDHRHGLKWLRGLRWNAIDDNLILRHTCSREKEVVRDLRRAPLVIRELERLGGRPKSISPMIVDPKTGLPYRAYLFRRRWRKIADAAGIPSHIKNMDSRSMDTRPSRDEAADDDVTSVTDLRRASEG